MSGKSSRKLRRSGVRAPASSTTPFNDLHQALVRLRRQTPKSAAINEVIQQCLIAGMARKKIPAAVKKATGQNISAAGVRRRISRMAEQRPTITDLLKGVDEELANLLKQASDIYARIPHLIYPEFGPFAEFERSALGGFIHRDWRIPSTDPDLLPDEEQRQKVARRLRVPEVARLFDECDALLITIGHLLFTREWRRMLLAGEFSAPRRK